MYILPFWKKISVYYRAIPPIFYFIATFVTYGVALPDGIGKVYEIFFISSLQYINMFLAWLFLYFLIWVESKLEWQRQSKPSTTVAVLLVSAILILYTLLILLSHFMRGLSIAFLILMEIFALIFLVVACLSYMFHKNLLGPFKKPLGTIKNENSVQEEIQEEKL